MRFILWLYAVVILPGAAFAQQGKESPATGLFGSVLPMMVVMFLIIYFLMIRPEQKKQKQRQRMINEMKKGDKVLTGGGIYGIIHNVKGDIVTLRIAENTNIEIAKSAVTNVISRENGSKDDDVKESKR